RSAPRTARTRPRSRSARSHRPPGSTTATEARSGRAPGSGRQPIKTAAGAPVLGTALCLYAAAFIAATALLSATAVEGVLQFLDPCLPVLGIGARTALAITTGADDIRLRTRV